MTDPATTATTPRRRRLQTSLTVSSSPLTGRGAHALSDEDSDQDTQAILHHPTNKENAADTADLEDAVAAAPNTPGRVLYTFQQKRRKGFSNLVREGRAAMEGDVSPTPKRARRGLAEDAGSETPSRKGKNKETPMRIRRERKRKAEKQLASVADNADSSEEDEDESDEDSGTEAMAGAAADLKAVADPESDNEEADPQQDDDDEFNSHDRPQSSYASYFATLHSSLSATSNNTLSKLPALTAASLKHHLAQAPQKHAAQREFLEMLHESQFLQWEFESRHGFNLLFYGYGSKRRLLDRFARHLNTRGATILVVNGFSPSLTIRGILKRVSEGVLGHTGPVGSVHDHLALVLSGLKNPITLLVHNIDAQALRAPIAQLVLSSLAAHRHVTLIASIDHINAPLLWDNVLAARYSWVWHDVATFAPYAAETALDRTAFVGNVGADGPAVAGGVVHVLRALNVNARKIFAILAEHQIRQGGRTGELGLDYAVWYRLAREGFYVANEMTFRTQLTEFRDHCIVKSRKGTDGEDVMYVPIDNAVLEGILETLEA
ncbi:Origin recognition complex subunit 2 [Geranomyces variabilis]|uniref:Origin recognition complex subunit 2 n=1 Tax=Geranomyces variabilis TaxID=109894 RepID=A0AAD5TRV1_9FUNG|nr:Origin recognition complex subunit 2 [Geranomyces variabilis]